jgi:hypothetical protein
LAAARRTFFWYVCLHVLQVNVNQFICSAAAEVSIKQRLVGCRHRPTSDQGSHTVSHGVREHLPR